MIFFSSNYSQHNSRGIKKFFTMLTVTDSDCLFWRKKTIYEFFIKKGLAKPDLRKEIVLKYSQKSMQMRSTFWKKKKKFGTDCNGLVLHKFMSCLKFLSERYDNESFKQWCNLKTRRNTLNISHNIPK